jgi:adenylyltransferase/sulfurtransferase
VGRLGLADADVVELSNLQRQILHGTEDLGRPKTDSALDALRSLNPEIELKIHRTRLNSSNAMEIMADYDLIVDGTDDFPARYLLNDAAALLDVPLVHGSVHQFEGQVATFWAGRGPCYRCLHPEPPDPGRSPSCGEAGVMGVLTGLAGSLLAAEAVKLILGGAETLIGRLILLDVWLNSFDVVEIEPDPDCPLCGGKAVIRSLVDYDLFCGHKDAPGEEPTEGLSPSELRARLADGERIQIVDVREPGERSLLPWPGALVAPFERLLEATASLDPSLDAVIVCKICLRSRFAVKALRRAGHRGRLLELIGGTSAWVEELRSDSPPSVERASMDGRRLGGD